MGPKRYVQHISGQGEKWEVAKVPYNAESPEKYNWCVHNHQSCGIDRHHYLPKSEYRLCDPPEQWEDVTQAIGSACDGRALAVQGFTTACLPHGYRWKFYSDGGLHIEKLVKP